MSKPRRVVAPTLVSLVLFTTVHVAAAALVNTGLDATPQQLVACAGRAGFRTSEAHQGGAFLNGDGDANDNVLHVVNLTTNAITNVMRDASGALACGGNLFAFGMSEANEGNADANGDGDPDDIVLQVYDASSATLTNVGFAVTTIAASANLVAFAVPEASQGVGGTDLNGDGDKNDNVLHVYDPVTMMVTNVGIDASGDIKVVGTNVAFLVSEANQDNTPLNGDGDASDFVLHVYAAATATLTNTGRQAQAGIQFEGDVIAFLVSESAQNLSLNPDADKSDLVLNLYCLNSPPCVTTGLINLALAAPPALGGDSFFTLSGDLVAISVPESSQNSTDLNGDGDRSDRVVHVYRISTGTVTNTMRAVQRAPRIAGNFVAFAVPERRQNRTDLNGDGDVSDAVVHVYNALTSTITNTQRAVGIACKNADTGTVGDCFAMRNDMLILQTDERRQGHTVLNGDADARDLVLEFWRLSTGTLTPIGLAADKFGGIALGTSIAAFRVSEKAQATDLNGDLDKRDPVMAVFDSTTLMTTVLPHQAESQFLVEGNTVIMRTFEGPDATDLNLDVDLDDRVVQYQAF